ncbi:50S ribosomal protein L6 [soil metagenome]
MSKIGKLPIPVASSTTLTIAESTVTANGPKGTVIYTLPRGFSVKHEENNLFVTPNTPLTGASKAFYGLARASLANVIKGVETGFEKKLELVGVGYRSQMQGEDLVLSLGYSHPVKIAPLQGVKISIVDGIIVVSGINKSDVGQVADKIHAIKPPEPYKGKGIKYVGEYIRRKAGKAAKAVGGK